MHQKNGQIVFRPLSKRITKKYHFWRRKRKFFFSFFVMIMQNDIKEYTYGEEVVEGMCGLSDLSPEF